MPTETAARIKGLIIQRRYHGRIGQIRIYLLKMLRMFLYQNDWMVLPMAALVAGLVGIVIRNTMFLYMEGTLIGALAVACVCLWNGCFNSIQVICRERDVVKREHRSGMHISSYIVSHMIYQAFLCLCQTGITIYVLARIGVQYPTHSVITHSFVTEFGISLFLITYAADMMSLWISALCRSTTVAMTVMPVVLIFQLVCSGGMMKLPDQLQPVSKYIISNVGYRLIAAEADYNNLEMVTAWNTVAQMRDNEFKGSFTVGDVAERLQDKQDPTIRKLRDIELLRDNPLLGDLTVGDLADQIMADDPDAAQLRQEEIPYDLTVGDVLRIAGEEQVRDYLMESSAKSAQKPDYAYESTNIATSWVELVSFALFFAFLATVCLEFIDKDKR